MNVDCRTARRLMSDVIDGAADARTESGVRAHLVECEQCRRVHEAWLRINETVRAVEEPPIAAGGATTDYWATFWQRLQPRLYRRPLPRVGVLVGVRWATAAAAALVLVACVLTALWAVGQRRLTISLAEQLGAARQQLRALEAGSRRGPAAPLAVDFALAGTDVKLFREVDATFTGGLTWLATDGDRIELGMSRSLAAQPEAIAARSTRLVAAQLTVAALGGKGDAAVSRVRLVARDGCQAAFVSESSGLRVRYECLPASISDAGAILNLKIGIRGPDGRKEGLIETAVNVGDRQEAEVGQVVLGDVRLVIRAGIVIRDQSEIGPTRGAVPCDRL